MLEYTINFDTDLSIKLLTLIIASILAIKAIIEYRKTQKWKKNEFLAKEIKDFFADRDVKKALLILDWHTIDLPLYENEILENKNRTIFFREEIHLVNSLSVSPKSEFTDEEAGVRKSIDEFLVKLSMFQNYIDNKLITINDLRPYLVYWMKIIGDKDNLIKESKYRQKLWDFIIHFEYYQVVKLLKNFGYKID
ncbi:hypothetical protein [Pedobacter sp. ASV28]|uniref:hypothetical protein n=1 Tax=Pedobacter sp. ASV28 TaxID=2795123 RepID=UPI0018EE1C2D|nr:hypothetical protein [Pedobacter sp. ASV28]